ncbi:hypothetical protein [uncultured Roseobacter sp.]|uniref:hypothetical protein n=1 Tax=uncultured Roseobacter sp. TaxID=114847 RepID=UPI002632C0D0|nr:hypothetical protein [uncultured Roseobacter sp.]
MGGVTARMMHRPALGAGKVGVVPGGGAGRIPVFAGQVGDGLPDVVSNLIEALSGKDGPVEMPATARAASPAPVEAFRGKPNTAGRARVLVGKSTGPGDPGIVASASPITATDLSDGFWKPQ